MELTLDQALQKGIEAHKAGRAQEADRYYTAILKANSRHPDANHNMGVLAVGVGKVNEALPFFKTALEVNPDMPQYWLSYIDALIKLDRTTDAKAVFDEAKRKGAKGDGFDKIEKRLGLANKSAAQISNIQDPPQNQLQILIKLHAEGQFEKALQEASQLQIKYPASVILYNILGAIHRGLGRPNEAIVSYKKALAIKPDYADAYNSMGIALHNQGKFNEAIVFYKKAFCIKPNYTSAYNNMGVGLRDQGNLDEAIAFYKKALSIKPNYASAFNNMGVALRDQGKLDEAIKAFNEAISIKSDYAEPYYNMGIALRDQGKLNEAITAFNEAISIRPKYTDAYNNLGAVLTDQGKPASAIEAFNEAISIKPDYAEAHNNMGNALKGFIFTKPNRGLQDIIISMLVKQTYVRPSDIAAAVTSLLKLEPNLQEQLQLANSDELRQGPLDVISELNQFPLLLKLMKVCPLPDVEIEELLKNLRASILANISRLKEAPNELLRFQSALALQCFTNEYIYTQTKEEDKNLLALEKIVKNKFEDNEQPTPQEILVLASYKALNQYDWCHSLLATDEIQDAFTRQVDEQQKEKDLKSQITVLEEIADNVSLKVREQYEENPYPRWVNSQLRLKPVPISKVVDEISLKIYDKQIISVEAPNILIAGCGTGQHSISSAAKFKSSKVVAIDLSLSSLAYAQRKTKELGIGNIEYIQADILNAGKLNRQFDIIESAGVLHHMDNPMGGWRVLVDCLKPGGLMSIGLYSELARHHIVKIRDEIKQFGLGSSDAEMKNFRDTIIASDKEHHKMVLNSGDFYSLSSLRDLLFHVQEHRFTIPLINDYLDELGLKFCGFGSIRIVSHFKLTNPHKDDPYNLDKWHLYEEVNPKAFSGMYQFWCQKIE